MPNKRMLVVCLGNICRSPALEVVLKDLLKKKGLENKIHVESRGLSEKQAGKKIDLRISNDLIERGYDVSLDKVSTLISQDDFFNFDYIFAVDSKVLNELLRLKPVDSKAHIDLVSCWLPEREEIFDPYKETDERMRQCIDLIERIAKQLVSHF